ncbi:hypothetical protein AGMMS49982_10460 [Bacteroidia bacterium]|nr:hypothetical protein AGMMS49982_10460 [Bacteroidia bacterium]
MMTNKLAPITPTDFLLYKDANGQTKIDVYVFNETVWMQQDKIAQLFGIDRTVVTKHLKNILDTGELQENSVCAIFAHTANDGKTYQTKFYNLDAILSVGYQGNRIKYTETNYPVWGTILITPYKRSAVRGRCPPPRQPRRGLNSLWTCHFNENSFSTTYKFNPLRGCREEEEPYPPHCAIACTGLSKFYPIRGSCHRKFGAVDLVSYRVNSLQIFDKFIAYTTKKQ